MFDRRGTDTGPGARRRRRPAGLAGRRVLPDGPAAADAAIGEYGFLLGRLIDQETLVAAAAEAVNSGVAPHDVLIARGWTSAERYVAALAEHLRARLGTGYVAAELTVPLDGAAGPPGEVAQRIAAERARGRMALLLSRGALEWSHPPEHRWRGAERAARGFRRRMPELSAGCPIWLWQALTGFTALGLTIGGLIVAQQATLAALTALAAVPFLFVVGLRVLALLMMVRGPAGRSAAETNHMSDADLPVYSILVPLLREAAVLPDLLEALRALDYPPAKLDVILIFESTDRETLELARGLDLPGFVRLLVVPDVAPRTKPRALNYALTFAQGSYVAIFDAEDVPEPDQLRRALAMFQAAEPGLACVQARLNVYNARAGWLTRGIMAQTPRAVR